MSPYIDPTEQHHEQRHVAQIQALALKGFIVDDHLYTRLSKLFFSDEPKPEELARIVSQLPAGTRDVLSLSRLPSPMAQFSPPLDAHGAPIGNHSEFSMAPEIYLSALDSAAKDARPWALAALAQIFDPNTRPLDFAPVIFTVLRRSDEHALALLDTGRIDLDRTGLDQLYPLGYAAGYERPDSLRKILCLGADPLARAQVGTGLAPSALMAAASMGCWECAQILAPLSDLDALNLYGQSAAELALQSASPHGMRIATLIAHIQRSTKEAAEMESSTPHAPDKRSKRSL